MRQRAIAAVVDAGLHRVQIDQLLGKTKAKGLTLVPLRLYLNDRGRVKVELGVARGRKKADKRQAMAERDSKLEMAKALGRRMKGTDR